MSDPRLTPIRGRSVRPIAGRTQSVGPLAGLNAIMGDLEELYRDVHVHPELSMQERRTAAKAAERLQAAGYDVTTGLGGTGVVGVLANGEGPAVMLRADM